MQREGVTDKDEVGQRGQREMTGSIVGEGDEDEDGEEGRKEKNSGTVASTGPH